MKTPLRFIFAACLLLAASPTQAAQQCLVLGDSLTKEYEVEFPLLYPDRTDAWEARNWIEILHEWRQPWFDQGSFSAYYDVRIVGHKHNWAFPGATTQDLRDALSSTSWQHKLWQAELKSQLKSTVERVVIFAGGNDVDSWYGRVYNGSSATTHINKTRDNLIWLVDYVRKQRSSLPIVLVSVPHVGCAPDVQASFPFNSVKTGRVTAALDSLNAQLATLTRTRGTAFAANVYPLTKSLLTNRFFIGTTEINRGSDEDALPSFAFSGDGFHPTSSLQSKVAQDVIAAFRSRWPSTAIPVLSDSEITSKILPALTP